MSITVSIDDVSVMVGIPAGRDLPPLTVKSLIGSFAACQSRNVPCQLGMVVGSAVVQWARDEVVDMFLASNANRLFWIDSDMVWEPWQFLRFLVWSKLRDVVVASYPAKIDAPTTFYLQHEGLVPDEYGLCPVHGIGLGFTVMTREVVERLAAKAPRIWDEIGAKEMAEVFRVGSVQSGPRRARRGEDMAFFSDIRDLGYQVHLDPSVDLGHVGTKTYRGSIRDAMK